MLFCPTCSSALMVEEFSGRLRYKCRVCPYNYNVSRKIVDRTYPKLKEIDDVLGGAAAWENVDSTDERCPRCSHPRAYFMQLQTRSADEPMTTFYKCCDRACGHRTYSQLSSLGVAPVKVVKAGDEAAVDLAVRLLKNGGVVALPTDTLYGVAADAGRDSAVQRLYDIKGRDRDKPVAICLGDAAETWKWARTNHLPAGLLDRLLPGAVTILLERSAALSDGLNPGVREVGVRVPECQFIRSIASRLGSALALTSANRSGGLSSVSVEEFTDLWPELDAVFDSGPLGEGGRAGSTVVDLSQPSVYRVVRPGCALSQTLNILHSFNLKPCS